MNGFGLNAAVQAFPSAYEFGRSLVGQDNATQERLFKQQLLRDELALKNRQAEDELAYRTGLINAQNYQNETARQEADARANLQGIQGNQITEMLPFEKKRVEAQTGGIQAETTERNTLLQPRVGLVGAQAANYGASTGHLNKQTQDLGMDVEAKQKHELYKAALPQFLQDPYSVSPELRALISTEVGMMANPHAGPAVELFDKATKLYQDTGSRELFNDELKSTMGKAFQPMIDQNTNAPPGSYRFVEFEPAQGGVLMKLQKVDPRSGQPVSDAPVYVTNGRVPMAEGGVPTVFRPTDVHGVLGGLRDAADWQNTNPEVAEELRGLTLDSAGTTTAAEAAKNRALRVSAQIKGEKDANLREAKDRQESTRYRTALMKDLMSKIDTMAGFDAKDFENVDLMSMGKTRDVAAIQQVMKLRQNLSATVSSRMKDMTLEDLSKVTADDILSNRSFGALVHGYTAAVRNKGVGSSAGGYTPPTTGGIQNSSAYQQ